MIHLEDRIETVLAQDEGLLDVLVGASPTFDKLRNPLLRKTMSKLATVEQAARVAGIDADDLLDRLNRALAHRTPAGAGAARAAAPTVPDAGPPERVSRAAPDHVIELDVREDLRAGREPFRRILEAARRLGDDEVLRLRAIFEPAPLYAVLGRQGLDHYTERLADDDWLVWFYRAGAPSPPEEHKPVAHEHAGDADLVVLDVRGLEPPEPMIRTFEALSTLPRGKTLVQINVRVPQFMLPQLAERGFVYEIREQSPDLCRIFIRHNQP